MELNQYQTILVNPDPTIGSEMKKTRPCLIISPDEMNKYLQTIIIAPMTRKSKPYPTRVKVKQQKKIGWVVLDQVRTIDRRRAIKVLGSLTEKEIAQVKLTLQETYVD